MYNIAYVVTLHFCVSHYLKQPSRLIHGCVYSAGSCTQIHAAIVWELSR